MDRRKFLKSMAAAVAVITVAPVAVASVVKRNPYPNMGWLIPGDPIKFIPITDAAYDGEKCNPYIMDEPGKWQVEYGQMSLGPIEIRTNLTAGKEFDKLRKLLK